MLREILTIHDLIKLAKNPIPVEGVVVGLPFTSREQAEQAARLMSERAKYPGMILAVYDREALGFNAVINLIFKATLSTYFAYTAQDVFAGRSWLKLAVDAMGEQKMFLGFNDGKWAGSLAGFGLARRAWAEKNYGGDFFCPDYHRHYADAELTLLAMQAELYVYEPNSVLIELDWNKDQSSVDSSDRATFLERKRYQFNGRITAPHLLNLIS
jgi:hypothetical protein